MNFLKKLFNLTEKEDVKIQKQEVKLSLDDLFVHNFVQKGGRFLYCIQKEEVVAYFKNILSENNWNNLHLLDKKLSFLHGQLKVKLSPSFSQETVIVTSCEHLIADNGDILFSSNQLNGTKLSEFPENFIVFATTSQIVKDTGQGLTGIKTNFPKRLPTNISSIKNYTVNKNEDNFLNFGNSNSKNLYLLLLEDL